MLIKKDKKNTDILILIILILFLIILNLVLYLTKIAKPNQENEIAMKNSQNLAKNENEKKNQKTIPQSDDEVAKYLSTLGEGNRMEYYCGQFIKYIDDEEYEKAYNLLYDEFKENYFPTFEEFENYVKNFYPKFFAVEYDDIDRYDDMYVLRLKIVDYNASADDEQKIQRVVIREYSYNNYAIAFSVEGNENSENAENTENVEEKTQQTENKPTVIIN